MSNNSLQEDTSSQINKTLEPFLKGSFKSLKKTQIGLITSYVKAFSLYLSEVDDAYKYNMSFLVEKNRHFEDFLNAAKEGFRTLEDIIKNKELAKLIFTEPNKCNKDKIIVWNGFWKAGLDGIISLCDPPEFRGVDRGKGKNVITIFYGDRILTYRLVSEDNLENAWEIAKMIEKIIGEGAKDGQQTDK